MPSGVLHLSGAGESCAVDVDEEPVIHGSNDLRDQSAVVPDERESMADAFSITPTIGHA